jgi:SAM-dependent methyltransferase
MICDDHSVSGESFALVKCSNCSLVITSPRPKNQYLSNYYKSDQYISHTDKANSLINIVYKIVRNYTLSQKVKLINRLNKKTGSLLDYGCGTGDFVKDARKKNWQAFGYEPDDDARNIADKKNKGFILSQVNQNKDVFDVITAWHVIEHVADLRQAITDLKKKLKDNGHLIIAVPNHNSMDAKHYGRYWAAYDVPRHLYHFNKLSMQALAKNYKLKLVETLPMKFDSYYVSMLSEKYKERGNFLNALKVGFNSNAKAAHNQEYSSLIYIFKK